MCDNIPEQVGVVIAFDPLNDRCQSLKAHPRVNIGFWQWRKGAVRASVKLSKDQIPDFQITITVAPGRTARLSASHRRSLIDMNFRTGAARSGVPHGPEIVLFTQPDDPIRRQTDLLLPDVVGLVIIFKDGDMQFMGRKMIPFRQQFPAPLNGFFLEVISKGEISQHFEKRMVSRGVAHVFQIVVFPAGPNAFLSRGRTGITDVFP